MSVSGSPTSLTMSGGRLWAGVAADGGSHRGGTLVIVTPGTLTSSNPDLTSVDPAFYNVAFNPQFTGLAYDALVNFQQSPGAAGLRLVPDLALADPGASRWRQDVRVPDPPGNPLLRRPAAARRRLPPRDRASVPRPLPRRQLLHRARRRRRLRPASGATATSPAGSSPTTPPALSCSTSPRPTPSSCSTSPSSPSRRRSRRERPTTKPARGSCPAPGRTRSSASADTRIRFARNPFFREWSHAAQPAGNPDSIVWRTVPTAPRRRHRGRARASRLAVRPDPARPVPPAPARRIRPNCTPTRSSPSTSYRSTPTAPRSTTSASGRRSTTRSTAPRSSGCTAARASPPRPAR